MALGLFGVPINHPWNYGRLIGRKRPLKLREVWSIRILLQLKERSRDLAMFNLAIDSKLKRCDLVPCVIDFAVDFCSMAPHCQRQGSDDPRVHGSPHSPQNQ